MGGDRDHCPSGEAGAGPTELSRPRSTAAGRPKTALGRARRRANALRGNLEERRPRVRSLDLALSAMERDHTAGGGLLSGAIAFRLFLWTLPMALVAVAGLGFLSDVNSTSPSDAVRGIGIHSIPAQSINQAAQDSRPARWWALLLGLILLYLASVSLMKALWAAHALLWRMEPPRITNKPRAVAWLVVALMAALVGSSLAAIARGDSTFGGLVAMLADGAVYAGIWWAVSTQLPHGDAPARALWPGALLFGLGTQAIHLFIVYFLAARVTSASRLYGGLGIAAQLLLGLYVIARLMVEAAVLNETLWTRNHAKQGDGWRVQG